MHGSVRFIHEPVRVGLDGGTEEGSQSKSRITAGISPKRCFGCLGTVQSIYIHLAAGCRLDEGRTITRRTIG